MKVTDLQEIAAYWNKKYPAVMVRLFSNTEGDKFFGRMNAYNESLDLNADTIGELISQGETFLRKVNQ